MADKAWLAVCGKHCRIPQGQPAYHDARMTGADATAAEKERIVEPDFSSL
jgi:hypothetical protein